MKQKIAIIGAGISGLSLAQNLKNDFEIEIFEKARQVGGRMSVKYHENYQFDKGAQHFTCLSDEFQEFLKPFIEREIVGLWNARFVEIDKDKIVDKRVWGFENQHFVAISKMNDLCKDLAKDKKINLQTEIQICEKVNNKWNLKDKNNNEFQDFDFIVFTTPPIQTLNLIDKNFSKIQILQEKNMVGCFTLMIGLKNKIATEFDAALVRNSVLSWISIDSSKPKRSNGFSIVANSTNSWAQDNIEKNIEEVKILLTNELQKILKFEDGEIDFCDVHRWRYANISKQEGEKSLFDEKLNIAVCGDFLIQGRIESAFLSSHDLALKLKNL